MTLELAILAAIPYPWTWNKRAYFYNSVQAMEVLP
jgi:hypothetical protein